MTTVNLQTSNIVLGTITTPNGFPLPNLQVAIFDVDMRSWQLLSEGVTDNEGKYELRWQHSQLSGRGKKTADIGVKVSTPVKGAALYQSTMDLVRFNAGKREEINITIAEAIGAEIIEFDYLLKEVTYLVGQVAITSLQENNEHRDITFLSKEMEAPAEKIEHLVVAHRLEKLSGADTDFFYALLRQNTLLHDDFSKNLNARLTIGMDADTQVLLFDAALTDTKKISDSIKKAIGEMIIGSAANRQVKKNLEILSRYKEKAAAYYKNEQPQKLISLLSVILKKEKLDEVQRLFNENKNNLEIFFDAVTDPSFFATKEKATEAQTGIALGKLFGFGNEIITRVAKANDIKKPGDVKRLARLNKAEWVKEITAANPKLKDKPTVSAFASAITRRLEKEFPTVAFSAQLAREKKNVLGNQDKIVAFLNRHEAFDLNRHNINRYFEEKKIPVKEAEAMGEELKSVQRVFRLIPRYNTTMALRRENIRSAQSIVALGKTRFVHDVAPRTGLTATEADHIFHTAENRHIAAMLVAGELHTSASTMDIAAFENTTLAAKLEAVTKDFPNLKSLFSTIDSCTCTHCRSVYSPAAYLVEILQFVNSRTVQTGNAKTVLFNRRPDLGEIDLGCENANTPVKYIDLVCELLEEAVAPDAGINFTGNLSDDADPLHGKISNALLLALQTAGLPVTANALIHHTEVLSGTSSATLPHYLRDQQLVCRIDNTVGNNYIIYRLRQTLASAEELDAAPEYVNHSAYTKLAGEQYAFTLPFDLDHTEARAYFTRFDISRGHLMQLFQAAGNPSNEAIAAEQLGLTDTERNIIITTPVPNDNTAQQVFWNVPAPGNVVDYMQQVDHFLDRTGLSFQQLDLLLKLNFIDPDIELFIKNNDLTCDTAQKSIANLDLNALDRIHRFLRLQKKTGWTFETLDAIISQKILGNGTLDDSCLIMAAQLQEISEKTGIKIDELTGWYGTIPHIILSETAPKPLYHQVFLNKARNGVIDEALEKVDGSQLVSAHVKMIATCLQFKQKDLEAISVLLPDDTLNFSNLSFLFAASRLAKKLKLPAADFVALRKLSGIDVFASPQKTLDFIQAVADFRASPLKPADVAFMLNHEADNLNDRVLAAAKIETLLKTLKNEYAKINTEQQSKFSNDLSAAEQLETLKNGLTGLVNGNAADPDAAIKFLDSDVATVLDFIDRVWISAANAISFIDTKFDAGIDRTAIDTAINNLDAAAGDITPQQKDLVKAFLDSIAAFFIKKNKRALLEQLLSGAFKTTPETITAVLDLALLKQPAPGTDVILDLLSDNLTNAVTPVNYPKQYAALRLLHKMLGLINIFSLSDADVAWYLANNKDLGWLELDSIPYETGQTAAGFYVYLAFAKTVQYAAANTPVVNPADAGNPVTFFTVATLLLTSGAAVKDDIMLALSVLTGYEKTSLDDIDTRLFAVFSKNNYRDINNWDKILECAGAMRKLDASIAQITSYIKPTLTRADTNDLRATLKSLYDENTWLGTLKEIMDSIRPKKRDALVAYLLATNTGIKDKNDLYEYFLVDVEMEACMPSSRIVQAHNSIQLFVQRCLLGLEPDAIADTEKDPGWNQWKWMKNYRVWEANRKIFLYPENWYDVSLTDDPSFLLTDLVNDIQQNELTNDTAEEALKSYLEKLDKIAFLEVMATWYEVPAKTMHVFARTKGGDPSIYYYRRFEKERYWSPWEKMELDITGDHLLAFKRNNRLNLAWLVFTEETDPNQGATLPDQSVKTEQAVDKPRKKLKIQLAISEYANNKWQPKRISKAGIRTPSDYTPYESDLRRDEYSLIYAEITSQVIILKGNYDKGDHFIKAGVFDIAGCKGYPELAFEGNGSFPDFFPDFKDAKLASDRYNELVNIQPDDLAVRNAISPFNFYTLLNATPGQFRISYPHQFTHIDLLGLIYEWFLIVLHRGSEKRNARLKIPLGTLLPYFMEDSNHAYVIVPGFYKKDNPNQRNPQFTDAEKRTASDVFQLMEDIVNWVKKMIAEFALNPPADAASALQAIITDPGLQDILEEMSHYEMLDFVFNFLIGKTGDASFDALLQQLKNEPGLVYGEEFKNMYHPLICFLRGVLYKDGIPALMKRETQLTFTPFNFETHYQPNPLLVPKTLYKQSNGTVVPFYPIEDLDFNSDGSYSAYNWDLFFRVPLHLATSLTQNQKFEDALTWFHYMFNPTGALPGTGVQKYWVTKPFFLNQSADYIAQRIDTLMNIVADPSSPDIKELEFAVSEWRNKPFKPDVVARYRPVAYQKALLMKYIDNLTEWGDYLFRQDTMESIAQATQMYILADKLLGPKPRIVPPVVKPPYETYNQLEGKLDKFSNALTELENILPDISVLPEGGDELPPGPLTLSMLYFCIPPNEKMAEYWDRVADRLFNIRHCRNIDGVERSLALFAPPIDPGMLAKAAASGLDISAVLADLNAPVPHYRFTVLSQKAAELAQEVRGLGNSLLITLEKKDAESLSLLRNELELKMMNAVKEVKKLQVDEANEQIEILKRTQKVTEERYNYYASIEKIITKEQLYLDKLSESHDYQMASQIIQATASVLALIPDFAIGASGFGGSPHAAAKWGGSFLAHAATAASSVLNVLSTAASYEANKASILGGYDRRFNDWKLQERLADKELKSIEKQIAAAEIRKQIAEKDLKNQELQIENTKKTDEFMRSKFTGKELYNWMKGQISAVYFKTYQLAHDMAKKAERCYRFELGNDDSYISYGYWDSLKKGLQSADKLIYDINRMETGYLDKNKREYEITKHISLAQLDPLALVRLKASGVCDFDIPEVLYDMDHPGHYFRRLKSVSISIPCIAGPYTSVSAKLSLVKNKYRKNTSDPGNYEENPAGDDRFAYNIGAIQSIAVSNAQNDSGMFELSFNDARYLPFERTGAAGSWRLELPTEVRQFDYNTIADVIIHVKYTAREGGSGLKAAANSALKTQLDVLKQSLGETGLHIALNVKHDMPNDWNLLKQDGSRQLVIGRSRLPYLAQTAGAAIDSVMFVVKATGNPAAFVVNIDATPTNLARVDELKLCKGNSNIDLDIPFTLSVSNADKAKLEELLLVVKYVF